MKKLVMLVALIGFSAMSFAQDATAVKPAKKHHRKHHKTEIKKEEATKSEMGAPAKK
jgi:Ni/Co efflux regulator RcnB